MHSYGRYPSRVRRFAGLLLTVAASLIVVGMGTGHGLVLAVGLVLAPFGLHLFTGGPAAPRQEVTILPNNATNDAKFGRRSEAPGLCGRNDRTFHEFDRRRTERHRPHRPDPGQHPRRPERHTRNRLRTSGAGTTVTRNRRAANSDQPRPPMFAVTRP
jgi:hypothetical protein